MLQRDAIVPSCTASGRDTGTMTARPPLPEFLKWAEERGAYVHPALDVFGLSARRGRGVMAKEAIKDGEQLMLIPIDLCIHSPTDKEMEAHEVAALKMACRNLTRTHRNL